MSPIAVTWYDVVSTVLLICQQKIAVFKEYNTKASFLAAIPWEFF